MSLVAYASSGDESENENEMEDSVRNVGLKKREPVKISIPSLKEFKEEEVIPDISTKPKSKGGSGLFSLLPPPKNSAAAFNKPGFTPYVFTKKKEVKTHSEPKSLPKKANPVQEIAKPNDSSNSLGEVDDIRHNEADSSSEKVDFFSLNTKAPSEFDANFEKIEPVVDTVSETESYSTTSKPEFLSKAPPNDHAQTLAVDSDLSSTSNSELSSNIPVNNWTPGPSEPSMDTNITSDFKKFFKVKGKKELENIDIIEVKADDQRTGKDEWLMQSITQDKGNRPSKRGHGFPTQQQKRKHQITYLAYQAKEREFDLKNQWALNSRTKRETQAKYGF